MKYKPTPLATTQVGLSATLNELVEKLAKNTHDVWAKQRISEGWIYGKDRNDQLKQTPCLVPYENLPENEKEYDRNTTVETLKAIIELGFSISDPKRDISNALYDEYKKTKTIFQISTDKSLNYFITLWDQRNKQLWDLYPKLHILLSEILLKAGEPLLAYDVSSQGLQTFGDKACLRTCASKEQNTFLQLSRCQALSLAQSGASSEAGKLLESLIEQGDSDPETYGLLGRTYKDMALSSEAGHTSKIKIAKEIYSAGYKKALKQQDTHAAYYNGINVATLSLLLANPQDSRAIAVEVLKLCKKIIVKCRQDNTNHSFWIDATLAETQLLLGEFQKAKKLYATAALKTNGDIRSLGSMQKQAIRICRFLNEDYEDLQKVFKIPTVMVFSGHMLDQANRTEKRFPKEDVEITRIQIRTKIIENNGAIAYASAACGSDILFLEEMLDLGGEINIVLPVDIDSFKQQSICHAGKEWLKRFTTLLEKATSIKILDHYNPPSFPNSLEFCNHYLFGLARIRAKQIGTTLAPLAVIDFAQSGQELGGTRSMLNLWQKQKIPFSCIALNEIKSQSVTSLQNFQVPLKLKIPQYKNVYHHMYLPILFADLKGYSGLSEEQVVIFSTVFLAKIDQVIRQFHQRIMSKRTMGDGLFFVFHDLETAINLARKLQQMIHKEDWSQYDLPANLKMRVSLDAGPCYTYIDPIMEQLEFCGNYIVRAARLEPITPPGHIYATDTFVALCQALGIHNVQFDYAGKIALAKSYGDIKAYHVR